MNRNKSGLVLVVSLVGLLSVSSNCTTTGNKQNNVPVVSRNKRHVHEESNLLHFYFNLIRGKTEIKNMYTGQRALPYLTFSRHKINVGKKRLTQLTCQATRSLSAESKVFVGILIEHQKSSKDRLSRLVGVTAKGVTLWNHKKKWGSALIGINRTATYGSVPPAIGIGKLNLIIPGNNCDKQFGLYTCQIYAYMKGKRYALYQRKVYVSKAQCKSKVATISNAKSLRKYSKKTNRKAISDVKVRAQPRTNKIKQKNKEIDESFKMGKRKVSKKIKAVEIVPKPKTREDSENMLKFATFVSILMLSLLLILALVLIWNFKLREKMVGKRLPLKDKSLDPNKKINKKPKTTKKTVVVRSGNTDEVEKISSDENVEGNGDDDEGNETVVSNENETTIPAQKQTSSLSNNTISDIQQMDPQRDPQAYVIHKSSFGSHINLNNSFPGYRNGSQMVSTNNFVGQRRGSQFSLNKSFDGQHRDKYYDRQIRGSQVKHNNNFDAQRRWSQINQNRCFDGVSRGSQINPNLQQRGSQINANDSFGSHRKRPQINQNKFVGPRRSLQLNPHNSF